MSRETHSKELAQRYVRGGNNSNNDAYGRGRFKAPVSPAGLMRKVLRKREEASASGKGQDTEIEGGDEFMKRVWLVGHGRRLGPFKVGDLFESLVWVEDSVLSPDVLAILGFKIEPATPERVTVTREQFHEHVKLLARTPTMTPNEAWQRLCDAAEGEGK